MIVMKRYVKVDSVVSRLREESYNAIPCYGVHPWFLHDVDKIFGEEEEWEWLVESRKHLIDNPNAIMGKLDWMVQDGEKWKKKKTMILIREKIWTVKLFGIENVFSHVQWKYNKELLNNNCILQLN